jgi:hypothetical protein
MSAPPRPGFWVGQTELFGLLEQALGSSLPRSAWEGGSASHPCLRGGLGSGLGKRVALALSVLVCLALVASLEIRGNEPSEAQ